MYEIMYMFYIPPIPNKYVRETIPISLSHPLSLISILIYPIPYSQHAPSPSR